MKHNDVKENFIAQVEANSNLPETPNPSTIPGDYVVVYFVIAMTVFYKILNN